MTKFLEETYKIRRSTPKGGHEISLPPVWIRQRRRQGYAEGEAVEILYDDAIIVVIPAGVKINRRVLEAAVEREQ